MPLGRRALGAIAGLGLRPGRATEGPVTLLVGAAAGTAADRWARGFAPFLERHWRQAAVAVVNLRGDGGLVAARSLAAAPPDGRLLGIVSSPLLPARAVEAGAEALFDRLAPVAAVSEEPLVLVGLAGSLDDLDALRGLGPGAVLGTPPHDSAGHLAGAALGRALPVAPLAFASGPAARQAVLAGNIPCALLALPEAIGALRDGRLSGLAQAQAERCDLLPDVPTFAERGIPLVFAAHRGLALPLGSGPELVLPLVAALTSVVVDPEFGAQAQAQGTIPRFIGQAAWIPMLRRTLGELHDRWAADPWTARRD